MSKTRLRDLGITIGTLPTGPYNAITDVPGVLVGQVSLIADEPCVARTGVTAIFPRAQIHLDHVFTGFHSFNGIGEMTGLPFIQETGLLVSPLVLTGTGQVGLGYDTVVRYGQAKYGEGMHYMLPVIAETWDGWLSDLGSFPLREEHFVRALETAADGPVVEGNTGGGTGMICYDFKGGTGTASRRVELLGEGYTVGVLVQANHGNREDLRVDGVPVGRKISRELVPSPWPVSPPGSSILIIIATDAPLLPHQCVRLAQRGTAGLARTGGFGLDGSGDLFLAFSTGIHYPSRPEGRLSFPAIPFFAMDPLIIGTVEAVEEAILNALVAAETMTGRQGHTAYALPHDLLLEAMR